MKLPEEIVEEHHAADLGVVSLMHKCGYCVGGGYVVHGLEEAESICPECLGVGVHEGQLVPDDGP